MLKKRIKYTDYNGMEREEDFYFNLSEAEIMRMNFTTKGGLEEFYNRIIAEQDMPTLYTYFEQIVQMSYGMKSLDGKTFDKDPEATKKFVQCPAYDKLMLELVGSSNAAAAFCNAIIPKPQAGAQVVAGPGRAPIEGVAAPLS